MNKRLEYIDVARGIGILLIILCHIGLGKFNGIIYSFHVPLFFIISGFLFKPCCDLKEYEKKLLKKYIIPYFFAAFVISICNIFLNELNVNMFFSTFKLFLMQNRYTTLWFLSVLFLGLTIFNMVCKVLKNNDKMILGISFIFSIIGYISVYILKLKFPWNIDLAFYIQIFIVFGYFLKQYFVLDRLFMHKRKYIIIIILFIINIVSILMNYFITNERFDIFNNELGIYPITVFSALVGSVMILVIAMVLNKNKILAHLGNNSMIYFLYHQSIAMPIATKILNYFNERNILISNFFIKDIFYFTVIIIFSEMLIYIFRKLKLDFLIGK